MKTFKYLLWTAAACCLAACGSDSDDPGSDSGNPGTGSEKSELTVELSKTLMQADGLDYVKITVTYGETDVTGEAEFYSYPDSEKIDLNLTDGKYTTTTAGTLKFWVAYETSNTYSNPSTITAVEFEMPERVEDPQPDNLDFVRRVLAIDFTGTACGYCPRVVAAFRSLAENDAYKDKYVLVADHSYNATDPMYRDMLLANKFRISSYPTVIVDMRNDGQSTENTIANAINTCYNRMDAPAGISVCAKVSGDNVIAHVAVKAAETNDYYLGAMVLESNIEATQANYGTIGDFSIHENAIRLIDATQTLYGYELGTINSGSVVDKQFVLALNEKWKKEDCHLVFYLCAPEGNFITVCNVIATEGLEEEKPFEYKE